MDKVKILLKQVHEIQRDASLLHQEYEKTYGYETLKRGVRFAMLQNDVVALKIKLVTVRGLNKQLVLILNSFQDPLQTMMDFLRVIFAQTSHSEAKLLRCIRNLAIRLDSAMDVIATMKNELHDKVNPVSKYSFALEKELNTSIVKLLGESEVTDLVLAVRNYAIVEEAFICADEFYGMLLPLYNQLL